ncbi:SMP-30/gluconolactonase/LRE family protein [Aeromicrobium camelliae]|uniref:SMP-30/gluconolactonase/LRE family protein n=1 Tax=Aeromicrobium camelliae TaxID=1538144 RepID=A0A3N6WPF6_9ACTN|nr:SMP-30/gluconolactonase/LRE family protein [Aeromicrobium camelliae]RQN09329.1 SMP-30/gluconolactonase/LRE family protein [Aeromicrobium camelliae]
MSVLQGDWEAVDDRRCELGEGARFLGDQGFVLVDLLDGRLYSTSGQPRAGMRLEHHLDVPLGAVAPSGDGWIAAAGEGVAVLSDDGPRWLAEPAAGRSVPMRMNDGVADPAGRFWAGAMPYDDVPGAGFLLRVDRDGSVDVVLEGLTIPNGPAISPDGRRLYLSDTPTGRIRVHALDPQTGELGAASDFAHVEDGGPDGMTVDAEGCLWSAIWGAGRLHRYAPDGTLVEQIPVPVRQPTSIALSDAAPYRVIVTSATHGLDEPADHDGRVITAPVAVAGLRACSFG